MCHLLLIASARFSGEGRVDAVRLLLENGANANARDDMEDSILSDACFHHDNTAVRLLLMEHGAIITVTMTRTFVRETLLHKLAKQPWLDEEAMEMLLEHGANPRIREYNQGRLLLDVACGWNHSANYMNDIDVLFSRARKLQVAGCECGSSVLIRVSTISELAHYSQSM